MSDRSGTMDAAVRVEDGQTRLVNKDMKQALPMGMTAKGDLYFGLRPAQPTSHSYHRLLTRTVRYRTATVRER
jgi:hypothetical protein